MGPDPLDNQYPWLFPNFVGDISRLFAGHCPNCFNTNSHLTRAVTLLRQRLFYVCERPTPYSTIPTYGTEDGEGCWRGEKREKTIILDMNKFKKQIHKDSVFKTPT